MKSNHDVLGEFMCALKKHRKACYFCKNEETYKQFLEQLKKKYTILSQRGLVTKMIDNVSASARVSKQDLFSYVAFNNWYMFSTRACERLTKHENKN